MLYDPGMNPRMTIVAGVMALSLVPGAGAQSGSAPAQPESQPESQPGAASPAQPGAEAPPVGKPKNNTIDWGPRPGIWRGEIELPGGKPLSFNFVVAFDRDDEKNPLWHVELRNGTEVVPVEFINTHPSLTMAFSGTEARIEATVGGTNTDMSGEYIYTNTNEQGEAVEFRLPFHADNDDPRRFAPVTGDVEIELAPDWLVTFDDRPSPAIGHFVVLPDGINVYGSVRSPGFVDEPLVGTFEHGRLRLSRFTGAEGVLYDGTIEPDGTLIGTYRTLAHHGEGFSATPVEDGQWPEGLVQQMESSPKGRE